MNSLASGMRIYPQNALSRASTRFTHAYGRSPAYRRLLSSPSLGGGALREECWQPSNLRPAPLRLPFVFSDISSASGLRIPSRQFYSSTQRQQEAPAEKPKTEHKAAAESSSAEPAEGEANKAESKKKTESSADGQDKKEGQGEEKTEGKEEKKEDLPPPPPHGDKTPWQVFMDTMQTELKASKEWNDSTKALASSAHQFTESESVQRARKAYEATSGAVSSTASNVVKTTADAIGKGAQWTWETPVVKGVRTAANATGEAIDKATKPIRDTETYKNVKDVIDDGSSSRYGGYLNKEERRKRREKLRAMGASAGQEIHVEDPNAGTNITVHKDAAWKEAWRDFRDSNKVVQGIFNMGKTYQESENPLVLTARGITDRIAGFFAENETAMVIKKFRSMDPTFQVEPFLRELREYILPEVLDAYVTGDIETLKLWLSEAQYSVYEALTKQYLQAGLKSDGRILDIRHVDILKARMLEPGEIPVFIITARTQEVHVYRNAKTNELAAGMEDKVQLVTYAIGITRNPDDVSNPETRGWRLIEMQKTGRDYY